MYCSKCGSRVNENYLFCTTCGASIKARQSAYQPSVNTPLNSGAGYKAPSYQNPAPAYQNPTPAYQNPTPANTSVYSNSYNQTNIMPYQNDYRVLGGFLRFLVIMYKYISPIALALLSLVYSAIFINEIYVVNQLRSLYGGIYESYYSSYVSKAITYAVIQMVIALVIAVIGIIVCVTFGKKLERRDPTFLKMFQSLYIVITLLLVLMPVVSFMLNVSKPSILMASSELLLREVIIPTIFYVVIQLIYFSIWNTYFTKSKRVYAYMGSDKYLRQSIFNQNTRPPV